MKSMLTGLLILAASAVGVSAQEASSKTWKRISGLTSGVTAFETSFIENKADWVKLWKRHAQGDTTKILPSVDWAKEKVVAVFLGYRTTAGYRIGVTTFIFPNEPTMVMVVYKEIKPRWHGIPAQVMTCPYAFVKVSKEVTSAHFENDRHYTYPQPQKPGKDESGRVRILPTHTLYERIGKAEGRVSAYGALLESRGL